MSEETEQKQPLVQSFVPVCAIGASAGGITALQGLFRQVPADLGLAYVVILHLSPDQPSALSEILAGCTRMSVLQIEDGPTLKPNCVYVIPPDRELVIEGDSVAARPFSEPRGRRAPIDMFFRSVAAARGDGVAIVLSGAGADGALGVRAVKEAGGVIMVQEPAEAGFASMPQNAIATGVADFVAPLARLAERLTEVAHSKEAVRSLDMDRSANELRRIVAFLRARTGHDFSSYKRATVMRRVVRRMQVCRTNTLAEYADYLSTTPEEAKELFSDLLISVTMFFRDAGAFEALRRHAIKQIFDEIDPEKEESIRAWVVGCATGEEAYSLAMLLHEEASQRKLHVQFQIFATDLDEGALATAREGRYPRSIEADVSDERLARFFVDEGTHFRVRKELRESVLFATHSVLKEPPFMRLDLITCRNLLIYLERALQQQLCSIFHYGLKPGRFLFLGSAETADSATELFAPLDRDARIYCARPHAVHTLPILPQFTAPDRFATPDPSLFGRPERSDIPAALHMSALERIAPASVLVDGAQNIVHLSPNAGRFMLHSAGPISNLLPAIVRPELRLDLRLALTRALDTKESTLTHPAIVSFDGDRRRISMQVTPVPNDVHMGAQALVFFIDGGKAPDDEGVEKLPDARPDEVRRLHAELKAAQEALVASRAGHEASIQDLRATNEELQSINEEYRSTAEELETSKEELQSINEELHTVNAELKSKLTSISVAHSDLQNLTDATEIGTLFLDADLRIKMFTPPIADLFNITKADIGRTITDFSHRLDYNGIDIDARRVLRQLAPVEHVVSSRARHSYVMRLRPYRTIEDWIDGVVVTFFDITERLRAEAALRQSEEKYRTIFDSIDEGFAILEIIFDENKKPIDILHLETNQAFEKHTGLHDVIGKRALEIATETHETAESDQWLDFYGNVALTGQPARIESYYEPIDRWIAAFASRVGGEGSSKIAVVFNDISERKRAEKALRESEERFQQFAASSSDALWIRDAATFAFEFASPAMKAIYGVAPEEVLADPHLLNSLIIPEERDAVSRRVERISGGERITQEYRILRPTDHAFRWIRSTGFPLPDGRGEVKRIAAIASDITEAKLAVEHQGVLLAELQHRVRNIMAVVRSITARTGERAETVQEYAGLMAGRLQALARVQALLTRKANTAVDIWTIVHDELSAQATNSEQYDLSGPDVGISPKTAEVVTLAIHELATNALKYGAFSVPAGRIKVRWEKLEKNAEPWLRIDWAETGAPPPADAAGIGQPRRGFGRELVEARIPYELGGHGDLKIGPDGARCVLEFPLREGASILATGAPQRAKVFGGALDMTGEARLAGHRILVIEDDYYLATDTARALERAGAKVIGPFPDEDKAGKALAEQKPSAAVLDINLGSGPSFKLAGMLQASGIPFVFITGYDQNAIPAEFKDVPRLQKPVDFRQIVGTLAKAFGIK